VFGYIKNPLTATGCAGVPVSGLGQYGTTYSASQTDFSGLSEGKLSDIKAKTDAIDAKIAAEIARLAAIVYTFDPGALGESTTAAVTTADPGTTAALVTSAPVTEAPATTVESNTATPVTTAAPSATAALPGSKSGCGSFAAISIIPAVLAAAVIIKRKKYNGEI
jgi:hypothetical protein